MKTVFVPALITGENEPHYDVVMVQKVPDEGGDNLWIKTPVETVEMPVEPIEGLINE